MGLKIYAREEIERSYNLCMRKLGFMCDSKKLLLHVWDSNFCMFDGERLSVRD